MQIRLQKSLWQWWSNWASRRGMLSLLIGFCYEEWDMDLTSAIHHAKVNYPRTHLLWGIWETMKLQCGHPRDSSNVEWVFPWEVVAGTSTATTYDKEIQGQVHPIELVSPTSIAVLFLLSQWLELSSPRRWKLSNITCQISFGQLLLGW